MGKLRDRLLSQERRQAARARLATARLLPSVSLPLTLALGLTTVLAGVLPVASTVVSGVLVGTIPQVVAEGFDSSGGRVLTGALIGVAVLFVVQQSTGPLQGAVISAFSMRVDTAMRSRVMSDLTDPPGVAHFEDPKVLNQVAVARGVAGGGMTPGATVGPMATISGNYLQAFLATAILARFSPSLAILLLAVLILARRGWRHELFRLVKVQTGQAHAMRHSTYFRDLLLRPPAAKETRVFGLLGWISDRFREHWLSAMHEVWADRRRGTGIALGILAFNWIPFALVFFALARAAGNGDVTLTELSIYAMAVFNLRVLNQVGTAELFLEYGQAAVPATLDLPHVTAPSRLRGGTANPAGLPRSQIAFEGVSFSYPGSDQEVFSGLDLDIRCGESLAIVGPNGVGKTTIAKLLCRFYDPTAGRIAVDGTDIREFDVRAWQARVGAIFQDFVRYELPARANVGFGALERMEDEQALRDAARRAGAEAILQALPRGWDTILSRRYTDGADLSGGEWQRVALARAMMAAGSGIGLLLLDEPTANLDIRGEAEIYGRFFELTQGLTTIVISHRFSTVRQADRICVLSHGRVVEEGSHADLLSRNGRYAHMFRLQATRFEAEGTHA